MSLSYATEPAIESAKPAPRFTTASRPAPRPARQHRCRPRQSPSPDAVLEHYLKRMDADVADSFTAPQREAIKSILGARGMTKHAIEIRRTVPFGKWRFYFVLLTGKEHRSLRRLHREGVISRPFNMLVYICLAALLSAPVLGAMLALSL